MPFECRALRDFVWHGPLHPPAREAYRRVLIISSGGLLRGDRKRSLTSITAPDLSGQSRLALVEQVFGRGGNWFATCRAVQTKKWLGRLDGPILLTWPAEWRGKFLIGQCNVGCVAILCHRLACQLIKSGDAKDKSRIAGPEAHSPRPFGDLARHEPPEWYDLRCRSHFC